MQKKSVMNRLMVCCRLTFFVRTKMPVWDADVCDGVNGTLQRHRAPPPPAVQSFNRRGLYHRERNNPPERGLF